MNFNQLYLILTARKQIILWVIFLTVLTTGIVSLLSPKTYTAIASVVLNPRGNDPITGLTMSTELSPTHLTTQTDIIASHSVALKVVDHLKLTEDPLSIEAFSQQAKKEGEGSLRDWLADELLKDLEVVSPSHNSNAINIEFSSTDPQTAAQTANAFVSAYIQTNLELKVEPARLQTAWFDEQIKGLRSAVEKAQKDLSEFQQKTGLIELDGRSDIESIRLAELSNQLGAAQAQALADSARQNQLGEASAKGGLGELPDIINNTVIQNLKVELAKEEARLADLSNKLGSNHPNYLSAQAEVTSTKQKIATEIQAARGSIVNTALHSQKREAALRNALAEQKQRVTNIKKYHDHSDLLTRELTSAQSTLDAATQRAHQIRLESQRNLTDVAVLNTAIPPIRHSKPMVKLNVILSALLGSLLGLGIALLVETIDRRIRSDLDISNSLGLPVLMVTPKLAVDKQPALLLPKL